MRPNTESGNGIVVAPRRAWAPLIGAWLVVLIPALWGVGQVVLKSLALFR